MIGKVSLSGRGRCGVGGAPLTEKGQELGDLGAAENHVVRRLDAWPARSHGRDRDEAHHDTRGTLRCAAGHEKYREPREQQPANALGSVTR